MTNVKRNIAISENLKWLRSLRGFTQKQIAEMLDIPLGTYSTYESVTNGIGHERLMSLCDFWDVDVEHLEMNSDAFQAWYLKERG